MRYIHNIRYRSNGNLSSVIRSQGRSVAWLAREINISRNFTSQIVHGHVATRPELATMIADKLQVPLFLLFDASTDADNATMEHVA